MDLTIVDTHPHIISPDTTQYPVDPLGGEQSTWSKERPASFDALISEMNHAGVAKAAIVHSSTVYGFDNSYVADSVGKAPGRFAGVYSVDMRAPDAVERIERIGRTPGAGGLRIFTTGSTLLGQSYALDDPATYEAWECAEAVGLPICVQVAAHALDEVKRMLDRFPNVTIILDHIAKPELSTGPPYPHAADLLQFKDEPRLVLKITPRTINLASAGASTPDLFFPLIVELFGAERVMWGSNYPSSEGSLAELLGVTLDALQCLSRSDLQTVMAGTAMRVYPSLSGFDKPSPIS